MSQHDFVIANQSFPATRTDLNLAILAVASNSSSATEPTTTFANQWWYETDTNILKIRNTANNAWVHVMDLDASMTAKASELNLLNTASRGAVGTVLSSDGTNLSWAAAAATGFEKVVFPSDWASPTYTYTSSGTYSKGGLADDAYVWVYIVGGGGGGAKTDNGNTYSGSVGGRALLIYGKAGVLNGASYVVGAGAAGQTTTGGNETPPTVSSFTLTSANGGNVFSTATYVGRSTDVNSFVNKILLNSSDATPILTATESADVIFSGVLPSAAESFFHGRHNDDVVFGGAGGAGKHFSNPIGDRATNTAGASTYAGNGAATTSAAAGVAPGGGGTIGVNVTGGVGAAGSVRIYNI